MMLEKLERIVIDAAQLEGGIDPNMPLTNYGIDSLSVAEIIDEIENNYGVQLDEDLLYAKQPSLIELSGIIEQQIEQLDGMSELKTVA